MTCQCRPPGHRIRVGAVHRRPGVNYRSRWRRLERGYHHLFTNDHAIIELIEEIGLSDELKWFPSRVGTYAGGRVYRTTTPLDLLRFGALPLYDRIKLGLFALRLQRLGTGARLSHSRPMSGSVNALAARRMKWCGTLCCAASSEIATTK